MAAWARAVRGLLLDVSGVLYDSGGDGGVPIAGSVEVAARVGGDEFCVLACLEHPDDLERMAEYLVATARALWEMNGEPPLICRLSVGGCMIDPEQDWQGWYACADAALYRVKARGGDGFEIHEPDTPAVHVAPARETMA